MSSDLLADLDSFYRQQPEANDGKSYEIEEEDWGDFQGGKAFVTEGRLNSDGKPSNHDQGPANGTNNTLILFDAAVELREIKNPSKLQPKSTNSGASTVRMNSKTVPKPSQNYNKVEENKEQKNDLLFGQMNDRSTTQEASKATRSGIFPKSIPQKPILSESEEEWADFAVTPAMRKSSETDEFLNTRAKASMNSHEQLGRHEQETPPTNVPPPALILTLFLQIMSEFQSELLRLTDSCRRQNLHVDNADDADFLRAYVETARVLARVIAGRRLRWKRDQYLSQGMKMGPASAKRVSGMKLASIDKAEAGREEKEVLDAVEAWRERLGRLRTVVAAFARSGFDNIGTIPDIQLNMPVKILSESEGGIASIRPCALCGLKRNERINRVDSNIFDSFGEWWNEATIMHRTCLYFWQSHRSKLQTG